eukprot:scaffold317_cov260-Pinguiococcus_pyrenoidosus.AAC.41
MNGDEEDLQAAFSSAAWQRLRTLRTPGSCRRETTLPLAPDCPLRQKTERGTSPKLEASSGCPMMYRSITSPASVKW